MVDTVQLVLLLVIVTLTILLVVLGIQVFLILRELRNTVRKANKVLDTTNHITQNVSGPISTLSSLVGSVSTGTIVAKALNIGLKAVNKGFGKDEDDDRDKRA